MCPSLTKTHRNMFDHINDLKDAKKNRSSDGDDEDHNEKENQMSMSQSCDDSACGF